jgi:hypothetical protein
MKLLEDEEGDTGRQIAALLARRTTATIPNEAVAGALLDGDRSEWRILLREYAVGFQEGAREESEWILPDRNLRLQGYTNKGAERFSNDGLEELVRDLESIDAITTADWLHIVVQQGLTSEPGLSSDSVALLLFKHLAKVDFQSARAFIERSMSLSSVPATQPGYFQLSILGATVAQLSEMKPSALTKEWLSSCIERSARQCIHIGDRDITPSVNAMLLAALFFALENSINDARFLDMRVATVAKRIKRDERRYFFQLRSDTLAQFLSESNSFQHWYKLLVLSEYLKKASVVWSNIGLVPLLADKFLRPAKFLLSK